MKKCTIPILLGLIIFIISGCAKNPYSYKFEAERTEIEIISCDKEVDIKNIQTECASIDSNNPLCNKICAPNPLIYNRTKKQHKIAALPAIALAAAPIIIDQGIKYIVEQLKKEADKYSATWTAEISSDHFFNTELTTGEYKYTKNYFYGENKPKINIGAFKIMRFINGKEAFSQTLYLIPSSDGFAFQLLPTIPQIKYSKSKLAKSDNTVDVAMQIKIDALWVNVSKDGTNIHNNTIADFNLPLMTNIELGSSKKGLLPASHWFPAVPQSTFFIDAEQAFGQGTFTVKVNTLETDDYGKRFSFLAGIISQNQSSITGPIKNLILPGN